jgi:hypothetical protein
MQAESRKRAARRGDVLDGFVGGVFIIVNVCE